MLNTQESPYSQVMKTLVTLSTLILLGLIVAYHGLETQVSHFLTVDALATQRLSTLPVV